MVESEREKSKDDGTATGKPSQKPTRPGCQLRYRKVSPRVWRDEKFSMLDATEKLIALYVITAQSNRIGLFVLSPALAAEELGVSAETFRERFRNVVERLKWGWDEGTRVVFLPTWWKYNQPENPNVMKGCLRDLDDLPQTPLLKQFVANTRYLPETLHETFRQGCMQRLANQEQEQEQEQYQEQEKSPPTPPKRPRKADPSKRVGEASSLPPNLDTPEFREVWKSWLDYRTELRKPLKPATIAAQLKKLAAWGPGKAIASIEKSIVSGWTGLFDESESRNGQRNQHVRGSSRISAEPGKYDAFTAEAQLAARAEAGVPASAPQNHRGD